MAPCIQAERPPNDTSGQAAQSPPQALTHALLLSLALLHVAVPTQGALLLTEIHYNGPASGTDPDEFVELSNSGIAALALAGYQFTSGISLSFAPGVSLPAGQTLVLARSESLFRSVFTSFSGALMTFSGALSNGGETLALEDALGNELWSVSYDDGGAWPASADGSGDSLQLLASASDPMVPGNWEAAAPTPGFWSGLDTGTDSQPMSAVPAPTPLWLMLCALCLSRRAWRGYCGARVPAAVAGSSSMPSRARLTVAASKFACAARVRCRAVK